MFKAIKQTRIPKGLKLPRKKKKWFKKNWLNTQSSITLALDSESAEKKLVCNWIETIYQLMWINKFNRRSGFGLSEIPKDDPIYKQ